MPKNSAPDPVPESAVGAFRFARAVLRPFLAVTTRHVWRGLDYLPRAGGCVVAANHISYFDPLIVAHFVDAAGRKPRFLGKANLFELPLLGRLITNAGQIPVHRETVDAARALAAAIAAVEQGECVVIYPEGTLTRDPNLWPMRGKTGAARVALATGCPVIPLAHWGAQRVLAKGQRVPRLWPPRLVTVAAGDAVDLSRFRGYSHRDIPITVPADTTPDVLRQATAAIMADVESLLRQIRCEDDRLDAHPADRDGVG